MKPANFPPRLIVAVCERFGRMVITEDIIEQHKRMGRKIDRYVSDKEHTHATAALRAKVERLEKALEFYADPFSWRTRSGKIGITPLTSGEDQELIDGQFTGGKRAREALAEKGDE